MRITCTALPITSAGRLPPLGHFGILILRPACRSIAPAPVPSAVCLRVGPRKLLRSLHVEHVRARSGICAVHVTVTRPELGGSASEEPHLRWKLGGKFAASVASRMTAISCMPTAKHIGSLEPVKGMLASAVPNFKLRHYSLRFYALRMQDAGIIKSRPQKIIANGTYCAGLMAAYVGLDPDNDIDWVFSPEPPRRNSSSTARSTPFLPGRPSRRCAPGRSATDSRYYHRPPMVAVLLLHAFWYRGLCEQLPVATKRVLRAILKSADLCVSSSALGCATVGRKGFIDQLRLCARRC